VLGLVALSLGVTLTWMTGIWVMPGGVDAYCRRFTRLSHEVRLAHDSDYAQQIKKLHETTNRFVSIIEQGDELSTFEEALDECKTVDDMLSVETITFGNRLFQLVIHHRKLIAMSHAADIDAQVSEVLAHRAVLIADLPRVKKRALQVQMETLETMRVPSQLRSQHYAFLETFSNYLATLELSTELFESQDDAYVNRQIKMMASMSDRLNDLSRIYGQYLRMTWTDPRSAITNR
jgi:hypothetical protein